MYRPNERMYMLATNEVFIQSFYVLHIKSIVLILCSHIYEYLPMGIDSTVLQYLIHYPILVGKVKDTQTPAQYLGAYSPAGKRREISVICKADVKSLHKWDIHIPICNKRENYVLSKNKSVYELIHLKSLLNRSFRHLL